MIELASGSMSAICLAHCLAMPLLLLILPGFLGLFVQTEEFHVAAIMMIVPTAFVAFWIGYRKHHAPHPVLLGVAGVGCLVIALLPGIGEGAEIWATVAGSLLLITGHSLNWRLRTCAS